jgi:hypothetical protein
MVQQQLLLLLLLLPSEAGLLPLLLLPSPGAGLLLLPPSGVGLLPLLAHVLAEWRKTLCFHVFTTMLCS